MRPPPARRGAVIDHRWLADRFLTVRPDGGAITIKKRGTLNPAA